MRSKELLIYFKNFEFLFERKQMEIDAITWIIKNSILLNFTDEIPFTNQILTVIRSTKDLNWKNRDNILLEEMIFESLNLMRSKSNL